MTKLFIFASVAATFGVTGASLFGWKWLICVALFFLFLYFRITLRQLLIQLGVVLIFFVTTSLYASYHVTSFTGTETNFQLTFTYMPEIDGNLLKGFVVASNGEKLQFRYTIPSETEKSSLETNVKIGLSCPVTGILSIPESERNQNSFNYQRYLSQQGIHWILKADAINFSACVYQKHTIIQAIQDFRIEGMNYVKDHFPIESRGYVSALLFGDQQMIDEEQLTAYQRIGVVHLLAISGLHISFLTGMLFFLGIRLGVTRERMNGAMLLFLPVYIILSGASPSVLRACFMAMLFFAVALVKKQVSASIVITTVYLLLLLYKPDFLYNIGFQLSFAVAFMIIMSLSIFGSYQSKTLQLLITSLICQLAAMPILLYYFFEMSIIGLFVNVILVPIYSVILLPFSIIVFLVHLMSEPIGNLLMFFLNGIFIFCNQLTQFVSSLPFASLVFGKPSFMMTIALIGVTLLIVVAWDFQFYKKRNGWFIALIFLLLLQYHLPSLSPFGEVTFIDIGQGDAIFIKLPFNQGNYLIDTGGRISFAEEAWKKRSSTFNTGEDTIIPYLKSRGIHKLDLLILTHPDADHVGSALEIVEHIKIKKILIGRGSEDVYEDMEFINEAIVKGIEIDIVTRGDGWKVGNAEFQVLNPYQKDEDINESSIVLYSKIGGLSWLFTGDAGEKSEQEIIQTYPGLVVDMLKVGHHGSKTSSSEPFITSLQPKGAIISVGKDNRYGHPHEKVLELFALKGIKVFRTDQDGAVSYQFNNESGTFSTALP